MNLALRLINVKNFNAPVIIKRNIIRYPINPVIMLFRLSISDLFRTLMEKITQHPEYYPIKHYKRLRRI